MKIFTRLEPIKNLSIALGFFDGIHLAHKSVISSAVKSNVKSAVFTFKTSPYEYFSKNECDYIISTEKRHKFFEDLGIDYLFEIPFTKDIAEMSANDYVKYILVENFSPKFISTGFNHTFGKDKMGTSELLYKLQDEYGYKYNEIKPILCNNEIVSSTKIKEYINNGNLYKANKMLGYDFVISGEVIKGNQIGQEIGFPTVNFKYPQNIVKLPFGVYKTKYKWYNAVTNYGMNPTLNGKEPIIETHILNFNNNLYNENIEIAFEKKIRDEHKFDSVDDLKSQIEKDIKECLK